VQQEDAGHEAETLTVTHLRVQQGVGFEQVEEGELTRAQRTAEVRVVGEGAPQVYEDGVLVRRQLLEERVVGDVVVGEEEGVDRSHLHAVLFGEELPHLASLASGDTFNERTSPPGARLVQTHLV
jgi:hypothetical protein